MSFNQIIVTGLREEDISLTEAFSLPSTSIKVKKIKDKANAANRDTARIAKRKEMAFKASALTPHEAAYIFVRDGGKCRMGQKGRASDQHLTPSNSTKSPCSGRFLDPAKKECHLEHRAPVATAPQKAWDLENLKLCCSNCMSHN